MLLLCVQVVLPANAKGGLQLLNILLPFLSGKVSCWYSLTYPGHLTLVLFATRLSSGPLLCSSVIIAILDHLYVCYALMFCALERHWDS